GAHRDVVQAHAHLSGSGELVELHGGGRCTRGGKAAADGRRRRHSPTIHAGLIRQQPTVGTILMAAPDGHQRSGSVFLEAGHLVSDMKGIPNTWEVKTKKNVKWMAELGSQSYGNPVIAGGMVFVGTNNEAMKDPKITGDKGILMAFRESDGEFLWQDVNDK